MNSKHKIVIIGNGMVGHRFIEELVDKDFRDNFSITTFCEEKNLAYDRVSLSTYFNGKTKEDLSLMPEGYYEENGVEIFIGDKAESIDRKAKVVKSAGGREVHYDTLVLATGSYPFVPPIQGQKQYYFEGYRAFECGDHKQHIHVYRTIDDLDAIKASASKSEIGTVIGGGLLGLECANALKNLGLKTHVVDRGPSLMGVQIDAEGGIVLRAKIEESGVQVHTSKSTKLITSGKEARYQLQFDDGTYLETDILVFSSGIRPRDEIARKAGLKIGDKGGIVIDSECRTSDEDVFAIGECALWNGQIFGLVSPGYKMAGVAADIITAQGDRRFEGADMSTKLKLIGVDVASIGDSHGRTEGSRSFSFRDELKGTYKKIVISPEGNRLLGAILIGGVEEYGTLQQMMLNEMTLPKDPGSLILPTTEEAAAGVGLDTLPEAAIICSCHNVTKGELMKSVQDGATTIGEIKTATCASTGCGGCSTMCKQLLDNELAKRGVDVNTDLCEHFPYTRQELYGLIRVKGIRNFETLLAEHGHGAGCEICKPAVASILAACWNEYILKDEHYGLQDTNDRMLANMQKDGTYSIVPRVAGGEITPEKLIALGEIAKKWNLYTKITGGQRIDLFGARQEQLPFIWEDLVAVGFESGHAYGKALRTVKSCVGSTWCRYGQQDSVGLAVEIETRYKGLRTPHKLKMAVSGCTRECAEAQGKDVGIIATDLGWNLYVCGNGGMKPRHADLLAADLNKESLIKYIDRFLMYYVRTADRLQRTAPWLENIEGGVEHLKAVIIEDSLGIAEQLEGEMAHIIDTYQCEWKTTVASPEKRKRFRMFVNSDETDNNVIFVEERGQIRPATDDEKFELGASRKEVFE